MNKEWMTLLQEQNQLGKLMEVNQKTERYGLSLREEDAKLILKERRQTLKDEKRIELGESITKKIIDEFCDSDFLYQDNYVSTIIKLQEIFFMYKNEMHDEITDEELLHFMKEQFETVCFGDPGYLEGTCLADFAKAVRAGYSGYRQSDGYGEYKKFDEVTRWDERLYYEVLKDLCWD